MNARGAIFWIFLLFPVVQIFATTPNRSFKTGYYLLNESRAARLLKLAEIHHGHRRNYSKFGFGFKFSLKKDTKKPYRHYYESDLTDFFAATGVWFSKRGKAILNQKTHILTVITTPENLTLTRTILELSLHTEIQEAEQGATANICPSRAKFRSRFP